MNGFIVARTMLFAVITIGLLLSDQHFTYAAKPNRTAHIKEDSAAQKLSTEFRQAADRATPGLVTIYTMRGPHETAEWRRGKKHPCLQEKSPALSHPNETSSDEQGSGIVVDPQGLILTCHHVVAAADVVFVVLPDGRRFEPVEVYADPEVDLALLQIDGAGVLDAVHLGNSDELEVGDWVVSLANPYELTRSVSAGIISGVDRWVPGIGNPMIQNDAATNPGSSGGALLNLQGEVVGIVNGGFGTEKEFRGIGLAIPINIAKQFIHSADSPKATPPGYLGCQTQKLPAELASALALPVAGGLYVKDVEAGSPAAIAQVQEGDIITHFDGRPIDDSFEPEKLYDEPKPGERHKLKLYRGNKSRSVEVQMAAFSSDPPISPPSIETPLVAQPHYFDKTLGIYLNELGDVDAEKLGYPQTTTGLLITEVLIGSPAYKEGLAAGMVLLRYNNHALAEMDGYREAMTNCDRSKPILMLVLSARGKHLVVFEQDNFSQRSD